VIKGFAKDLTGYTNCVTTNNCSPETANLRENIKESGIDDESKKYIETEVYNPIHILNSIKR
jgi:hypothetical protein